MNNELAIMPVMDLAMAATRRQAMTDFVKGIMRDGVDYGVIPGTGNKPTLLKPGAEKLSTFFGLSPMFDLVNTVEDWTGKDHDGEPFFYYHYRCSLYRGDLLAGQGEGSCNSWEKKYRYRTVSANKATEEEKETGRIEQRSGKFGSYSVYVVPNPNPADLVNTISKMAQKRALVAATLIAVNASEFFTQDVEDMDFGAIIEGEYTEPPKQDIRKESAPAEQKKRNPRQKPAGDGNGIDWKAKAIGQPFSTFASCLVNAGVGYNHEKHIENKLTELGLEYDQTESEMIWNDLVKAHA